ncbi:MAG: sugar phosphate isomerase/epimerase family protein [Patescibacteria group bacterium]
MDILCACGDGEEAKSDGFKGVECSYTADSIPLHGELVSECVVLHLGDLRFPYVGELTNFLRERIDQILFVAQVDRVVIHAESALGWLDGERQARKEFWNRLSDLPVDVVIENNVVKAPNKRYDFIRDPLLLLQEVSEAGLGLALDVSHAAWFYKGWPEAVFSVVRAARHLHLSDWRKGEQHLPLGEGLLPIEQILSNYTGKYTTLEVRDKVSDSLHYLQAKSVPF